MLPRATTWPDMCAVLAIVRLPFCLELGPGTFHMLSMRTLLLDGSTFAL